MLNTINQTQRNNTNSLLVPQAENSIEQLRNEIAIEMGIELGADTSSRNNGRVGGEMTKRLVALGQQAMMEQNSNNSIH